VLRAKYYPQGNIIDTVFTGNPSSTWMAIAYGLELLKKGVVWRTGNGKAVRIRRDNRLPLAYNLKVIGDRGKSRLNRVSSLLDDNGAWKEPLVRKTFPPIDVEVIIRIKTSPRRCDDFLAWQLEKSGIFSVRSAYKLGLSLVHQERDNEALSAAPVGNKPIWKTIWKSNVPEKVRIFAWRAVHNALATKVNKHRRHMPVSGMCMACGLEQEDVSHMIFRCTHAVHLWQAMREV
jgi:hypothetical protein